MLAHSVIRAEKDFAVPPQHFRNCTKLTKLPIAVNKIPSDFGRRPLAQAFSAQTLALRNTCLPHPRHTLKSQPASAWFAPLLCLEEAVTKVARASGQIPRKEKQVVSGSSKDVSQPTFQCMRTLPATSLHSDSSQELVAKPSGWPRKPFCAEALSETLTFWLVGMKSSGPSGSL